MRMLSLDGAGGPVTMIYETARAEIFSPQFHLKILSFHLRLRQFDRLDVGISKRWLASSCFPYFLAFDFHNKDLQTFRLEDKRNQKLTQHINKVDLSK